MRLFIGDKQYFSIEEYANAIVELAIGHKKEEYIAIHVYKTDEDRINMRNTIGGFVPYKSYSIEQIRNGIMTLIENVSA